MFKKYAKLIAKVGWLLVALGFFMPVSCNQSGMAITKEMLDSESMLSNPAGGICLALVLAVAVIAIVCTLLFLVKNLPLKAQVLSESIMLAADIALAMVPLLGMSSEGFGVNLNYGAGVIVCGWIVVSLGIILNGSMNAGGSAGD